MVKSNKIKNFWIAFFALLSVAAIVCSVVIFSTAKQKIEHAKTSTINDENVYKQWQENSYKESLHIACCELKNLDENLGKVALSTNGKNQATILASIVANCNAAEQCLTDLPIDQCDNLYACHRFINQTGDYATYLIGQLAAGKNLQTEHRTALNNLDGVATKLSKMLEDYTNSDAGMFMTNSTEVSGVGKITDTFEEADCNCFKYGMLNYDGDFSESVQLKNIKIGKKISVEQGQQIVQKLFGECRFVDQINGKNHLYDYDLPNGRVVLTADGNVLQYQCYAESNGQSKDMSNKKCTELAEEFCKKMGYDVKAVLLSKPTQNIAYVNCATVVNDVVVYPEMVSVAVDVNSGKVVGMQAKQYLTNCQDRNGMQFGNMSKRDVLSVLDKGFIASSMSKVLIEKYNVEHLCYQVEGLFRGKKYCVFVDSNTGEEVDIIKINSTDTLL